MNNKKNSPFRQSVKPVSKLTAQSAGLCAAATDNEQTALDIIVRDFLKNYENTAQGAMVGLLYSYGLRVSEMLSITGNDILPNGFIFIRGSKGSDSRLISPVYNKEFWVSLKSFNKPLSTIYSRFFLYREMKKFGIYAYFGSNQNRSVTHSLRHIKVLSLKSSGVNLSDVSRFIGHKSLKSISYYEQAIRK